MEIIKRLFIEIHWKSLYLIGEPFERLIWGICEKVLFWNRSDEIGTIFDEGGKSIWGGEDIIFREIYWWDGGIAWISFEDVVSILHALGG